MPHSTVLCSYHFPRYLWQHQNVITEKCKEIIVMKVMSQDGAHPCELRNVHENPQCRENNSKLAQTFSHDTTLLRYTNHKILWLTSNKNNLLMLMIQTPEAVPWSWTLRSLTAHNTQTVVCMFVDMTSPISDSAYLVSLARAHSHTPNHVWKNSRACQHTVIVQYPSYKSISRSCNPTKPSNPIMTMRQILSYRQ